MRSDEAKLLADRDNYAEIEDWRSVDEIDIILRDLRNRADYGTYINDEDLDGFLGDDELPLC